MKRLYKRTAICDLCERKYSGKDHKMIAKLIKIHMKTAHNKTLNLEIIKIDRENKPHLTETETKTISINASQIMFDR